ncbi:hypothetical protein YN1_8060 [Nanoarchaeota archaeon]
MDIRKIFKKENKEEMDVLDNIDSLLNKITSPYYSQSYADPNKVKEYSKKLLEYLKRDDVRMELKELKNKYETNNFTNLGDSLEMLRYLSIVSILNKLASVDEKTNLMDLNEFIKIADLIRRCSFLLEKTYKNLSEEAKTYLNNLYSTTLEKANFNIKECLKVGNNLSLKVLDNPEDALLYLFMVYSNIKNDKMVKYVISLCSSFNNLKDEYKKEFEEKYKEAKSKYFK